MRWEVRQSAKPQTVVRRNVRHWRKSCNQRIDVIDISVKELFKQMKSGSFVERFSRVEPRRLPARLSLGRGVFLCPSRMRGFNIHGDAVRFMNSSSTSWL